MDNGIYKAGRANMCLECARQMEDEYVLNKQDGTFKGTCERCGTKQYVSYYSYLMKWRVKKERGYVD